ncbi:MAG: hypothetical protein ACRDU8_07005 [Egibacteraceae bacterium]
MNIRLTTVAERLAVADRRATDLLQRLSPTLLRGSLALVFIWFGALKVVDVTPVGDLVADTVPFLDASWFVPALGGFEILLGVCLVAGWPLRLVLGVLAAHLAGTFLVLVTQPEVAFQAGNPFLLTVQGEFVVKNLVLIAAALALAAQVPSRSFSPVRARQREAVRGR